MEGEQTSDDRQGAIRVAPAVLRTIVARAALSVPGVVGLGGHLSDEMKGFFSGGVESRGIKLRSHDDELTIDLYVILSAEADLLQVGRRLQAEVARAVDAMVALAVAQVNVYIQDVR